MSADAKKIFLVAGEASADLHAASLLARLKEMQPNLTCFGVGGPALAAEGMDIRAESSELSIMGFTEWFDRAGEVIGTYRRIVKNVREERPDCAVLLDLPDFNLRIARELKKIGVPVVYYISPQVWAWRKYRVHQIRERVDRMLVVFPFEKKFYDEHDVRAEFVGHPLLEHLEARTVFRSDPDVKKAPQIAVLPGSRRSEIRHHALLLREVITKLRARYPEITIRVPIAPTLDPAAVKDALGDGVEYVIGQTRQTIAWADVALVASGTATLETALIGTPFCLYYRMNQSTIWFVRHVIRYRGYVGMPNLLQGREVAREFIQEPATVENLFGETVHMIEDGPYRRQMSDDLLACREALGNPGASRRAAEQVSRVLSGHA